MTDEPLPPAFDAQFLLSWPVYQPLPQLQPLPPDVMPQQLPPTTPNPLLNGNIQTILSGTGPNVILQSVIVGPNGLPLKVTPSSPSNTLEVVFSTPAASFYKRTAGTLSCAAGGAAPAPVSLFLPGTNGTRITSVTLSLQPTAATTGIPYILVTIGNVLIASVGLDAPIQQSLDGPIIFGPAATNQISVAARGAGAPAVDLYFNVNGIDLT